MNSKDRYENYLKTDYWKAVSVEVKKRAGYRCQVCNSQMDLVAHHRCYDHRGKELEHLDDLICLCVRCHSLFHGKVQAPVDEERARKKPKKRECSAPTPPADVEKDMPPGDGPIVLTDELIQRLRTNGAFCNAAVIPLGITWDTMTKGWPNRLVGKEVSREVYRECLRGRLRYGVKLPR